MAGASSWSFTEADAADIAGRFAAWRNDIGFEEIMIAP